MEGKQVVTLCCVRGCGGQITKTHLNDAVIGGRPVTLSDLTCTRGGDSHVNVKADAISDSSVISTDAPVVPTDCSFCHARIVAGQEWTTPLFAVLVHVMCVGDSRNSHVHYHSCSSIASLNKPACGSTWGWHRTLSAVSADVTCPDCKKLLP